MPYAPKTDVAADRDRLRAAAAIRAGTLSLRLSAAHLGITPMRLSRLCARARIGRRGVRHGQEIVLTDADRRRVARLLPAMGRPPKGGGKLEVRG